MIKRWRPYWIVLVSVPLVTATVLAEQPGSIRGIVYDKDFEVPLAAAQVSIVETGEKIIAADEGNFLFGQMLPGTYTLIFSKEGYARHVEANVVVSPGQMTEVDAWLSGEFTEMEEFVVQDLQIGGGTEAGLLRLRIVSPALLDSISSNLISQAGAGDVATALKLVSGAAVQDGKYAVIRGLPDRYVNSQMNSVRLPTADTDKRAVQLDQFPSALIESIRISKTFTPDQQGDASGGAVNVILKNIPDGKVFKFKMGSAYNSQATGSDNFLSYEGGGVDYFGMDDGNRELHFGVDKAFAGTENPVWAWDPAPGADDIARYNTREEQVQSFSPVMGQNISTANVDHNWSVTAGNRHNVMGDLYIGLLGSFYYKREYGHYEDGINDKRIGDVDHNKFDFHGTDTGDRYELYDVTESKDSVICGGLVTAGIETENQKLDLTYMQTRAVEDLVLLMEDTRALEMGLNNAESYFRNVTLKYKQRSTSTLQLHGKHMLPIPRIGLGRWGEFLEPEIDWTLAHSEASLWMPDMRGLVSQWTPDDPNNLDGNGIWRQINVAGNYVGRRTWRDIEEKSDQGQFDGKIRFTQWTGDEGFFKIGLFRDKLKRTYEQDSFSYLHGPGTTPFTTLSGTFHGSSFSELFSNGEAIGYSGIDYDGGAWYQNEMPWQIVKSGEDADYDGKQKIKASYWMVDLPITSWLKVTTGVRTETTFMETKFKASDGESLYFFKWSNGQLEGGTYTQDDWHLADTTLEQTDWLPAYAFELELFDMLKLRGAYTETVARPTFKEIAPILQRDYIGSDQFIGNNNLNMSELKNYDLRFDFYPLEGSFFSGSYFYKKIVSPIEYATVAIAQSPYVQPFNFPYGWLKGYEMEARQDFGKLHPWLKGLQGRFNATIIDSEVTVPLELPDTGQNLVGVRINADGNAVISRARDMKGAPEYLLNASIIYDISNWGTQFSAFYTRKGDTLVAGEGISDGYFPNVYAKGYAELALGLSQKLWNNWKLTFRAKNVLNPKIEEVYRSSYIDGDALKTSYRKGRIFSISLSGEW
ncbi:MAG: carboxypeptidase regulatory-like domain-containing protein [Candidatus Omnitrophota bacterium]|nr:carboxypeptidase regulatory-like domain-containing protein [Candidatus Omnitrophota bacterium]